ncbi:lysosome membrane protein 2-like [Dendronephthya gigantea]|uniref:lysosome membrane protein 2-like n=1 Tax=Dendronephthya gigantea TaxID=151771 RepID=UPI00106D846B|nr:lysosome membrane protein 2-like [Dendronephthya gigantea]
MRCCKHRLCCSITSICLITCGFVLTVAMAVCILAKTFDNLIKEKIKKNVELKEGSETLKDWKSPSSQVYMQYFMFNLSNPSAVKNGGRPSVKQIGPYSYRELRHNVPRYFNHSADTIVYFSEKAYVFDSTTSCAGCDPIVDKIHTINIPLLKIAQLIEKILKLLPSYKALILPEINEFLNANDKVFAPRTVNGLLWGYEDPILDYLKNFTSKLNKTLAKHGFKLPIPTVNPIIKLQTNNSNTTAEIHTGVGDINRIGQYVSYNNFRLLPWWHTKWANMLNGTDASMFHPDISEKDKLYTFVSDVCRSLYLIFKTTTDVHGIPLYKFYTPKKLFKYTPDVRAGFCAPNKTCVPDGLLDISVCQPMQVPIVVSLPHFLFANESVIKSVDGMHPNEDDHATFVSVEPNTGITMKASKRIQINVNVDKVDDIDELKNLKKVYLPVLFVNESAVISESDAEKFKKDVLLLIEILNIGKYVLLGVGCLMMLIGLLLLRYQRKLKNDIYSESTVQVQSHSDPSSEKSPLLQPAQNYVT